MKELINALQTNPCSEKDLRAIREKIIPGLTPDAHRNAVGRFLKKFIALGLVEQRGKKYCWYVYFSEFENMNEYSARLNHSKLLVPVLEKIGYLRFIIPSKQESENSVGARLYYASALDHLRCYKHVWELHEEHNSLSRRIENQEKELSQTLFAKVKANFDKYLLPPFEWPMDWELLSECYVTENLPSLIQYHIINNSIPQIHIEQEPSEKDVIYDGQSRVGKGRSLLMNLKKFLLHEIADTLNITNVGQIEKAKKDVSVLHSSLGEEVEKIIMKIRNGEPLMGKCEICPQSYFSHRRNEKNTSNP